jgi:hypothetical protein
MRILRLRKIYVGKSIVFFIKEVFLESEFVAVEVILNFIILTLFQNSKNFSFQNGGETDFNI